MSTNEFEFIKKVSDILCSVYYVSDDVADFIGCQFALESSYGRSPLAVNHQNYCGMKCPSVRVSVADNYRDKSDKWAYYSSLEQCICDYMFCLSFHHAKSVYFESIIGFSAFIEIWYCPEKSYLDKINQIYSQFKSFKNVKNS